MKANFVGDLFAQQNKTKQRLVVSSINKAKEGDGAGKKLDTENSAEYRSAVES